MHYSLSCTSFHWLTRVFPRYPASIIDSRDMSLDGDHGLCVKIFGPRYPNGILKC